MKNNINKYIVFILIGLLILGILVYKDITKNNLNTVNQIKIIHSTVKAQPLQYTGSIILNKFNKKNIDEYQTAAGTYDIQTIASEVTSTMLAAFKNSPKRTLPLVANWNVGIPEYSYGLDPLYLINRFTYGEHLVPTWKLDPYYNDNTGLSYYEASIKKAAKLGLPLVFILPSPESALTKDDIYFSMDKTQNPNILTVNGTVLPKLSPFGPDSLWQEVGAQWSTTTLMAQLQEWYPNPPLVIFIDEDTSKKLSWSKLATSSRYIEQYPTNTSNEFKRTLVNAKWLEKYRQLHEGFKQGFTQKAWKQNVKFVTRNQLVLNMGVTSDWINSATATNQYANIWPLTADGLTINFNLDGDKTDTTDAPHRLLNNLPFMLEEAKELNPNFTYQLSIDANQKIDDPQRYRGFTQFALWFLRPSIIRQTPNKTTKDEINPLFQQVVDSVELIHNSDVLADFWKNGKLVSTGTSLYNQNIPTNYQSIPREFLLKTDATSLVWAFALKKDEAPNREWLVYIQSPEENLSNITVTIPDFENVSLDATQEGDLYTLTESATPNVSRIKINIDFAISSVQVTNITQNSASIKWNLTNYATGQVEYGTTLNYGDYSIPEESFKYKRHTQTLKNLAPNTTYHYRVISIDKNGNKLLSDDATFTTLKKAYYVSTLGKDSNDGTTEATPWLHISYAANQVKAGDIVYIKAGEYPKENIIVKNSGTTNQPIVFEGYKTIPHDTPVLNWSYSDNNLTLGSDSSVMPLLNGKNRKTGTAIIINNKQNIIFRNIQIQNYKNGIIIEGNDAQNNMLENIIAENFGDLDADYAGNAIVITNNANHNYIKNSIVLNAGAQAFTIIGDYNQIDNCKAYANDNRTGVKSATDYYFIVVGNYNKILNSYAERKKGLAHGGHGFNLKYHAEHNLVKNCATKNISGSFVFRHSGVQYNTFEDINATGTGDKNTFGLTFRDGASNNIVKRYYANGINHAITFRETTEDGNNEYTGRNNIVKDSIFKNIIGSFIIYYKPKDGSGKGKSLNNTFKNIIFDGSDSNATLFETLYDQQDNTFENCTFINIKKYTINLDPGKETFINASSKNLGFSLPK
jgi:hypothetical protein